MINNQKAAHVALNFVHGIGPKMLETLLERFLHPEAVIAVSIDELCTIPRLTPTIAEGIKDIEIDAIVSELTALEQIGITVHTLEEEDYPQNLRSIPNPPLILFQVGTYHDEDTKSIAIVGTRKPSASGAKLARQLAVGLVERGFTIASGLALGIDTAAHQGTLEARGRTLAVLGSGIQVIHPRRNQGLAEQIRQSGAIFSESKPNARANAGALMSRDRIVSGLALATIAVEASDRSGSMDTANQARKQNRKLFAIDNEHTGNQRLIAEGATAITDITETSLDWIAEATMTVKEAASQNR